MSGSSALTHMYSKYLYSINQVCIVRHGCAQQEETAEHQPAGGRVHTAVLCNYILITRFH